MPQALRLTGRPLGAATLAAVLLTVAGSAAAAQEPRIDARLAARLDGQTATAVSRLVDSVRAVGLPSDPLIGVALEGASRRAGRDVILAAVREYAAALGAARSTLGASASAEEIVSGAGIILAGVPSSVLPDYRAARPAGSIAMPLIVLADLVARGVPADSAASAVRTALEAGARDEDLSELRRSVERDILAGARPATAMALRLRNVPGVQGVGPRRPRGAPGAARRGPRLGRPGG